MRPAEEYEADALRALQRASEYGVGPAEWDACMRLALVHATLAVAAATSRNGAAS